MRRALVGNAKSSAVTCNAWTSTTEPRTSATACRAKLAAAANPPHHQRMSCNDKRNSSKWPTRSLVISCADR